jgi:hypothetical protein
MSRLGLYAVLLVALVVGVPLAAAAPEAPPPPTITSTLPSTFSTDVKPTFAFADADPAATFECRLTPEMADFSACPNPFSLSLQDGLHTFDVRAVATGEKSVPRPDPPHSWTIDTKAPALTISQTPDNPTDASNAKFVFKADDLTSVTYKCRLDGQDEACSPPDKSYSNLSDGTHVFTLQGTDAAGNTSATTYSWLVDKAKPIATITSSPRNPTNQASASFSFSSNKTGSDFRCKLDTGGFSDCKSPKTYGALDAGTHTFSVKASATGPTTNFSWTIDLTPPPAPTISGHPTDPSNAPNASFNFSDSEAGVSFGCQVDGGGFPACTSPAAYSGLGAGSHTFAVRATDPAGNTGTAAVYGWTVKDAIAPGDVRGLKRTVGYRTLKLTWSRPPDADFSYVRVFVAKGSKAAKGGPLRTSVYKGTGTRYTNKRFSNGTYYRYAIISYDKAGNASRGVPVVVPTNALLSRPLAGARVNVPPFLDWASVPKATFYNVQLYLGSRKILSAWPTRSKLKLSRTWSYKGAHRLKKGSYRWYVWPAFGGRSKARYGQLLGQANFFFAG